MRKSFKNIFCVLAVVFTTSLVPLYSVKAYDEGIQAFPKPEVIAVSSKIAPPTNLDNFSSVDEKTKIPADKIWTIKFNETLNPISINKENIGVVDLTTNETIEILMSTGVDEQSIVVSLPEGTKYIPGHSYCLYATAGVRSSTDKNLKPMKMKFTIDAPVETPVETPVIQENIPSIQGTMYNTLKTALLAAEDTVNIKNCIDFDYSKMGDTISKVLDENPLIMYYNGGGYSSNGVLKVKYKKDKNTCLAHAEMVKLKAQEIIAEVVKPGMDDYEKEKAVHDYIINNARYHEEDPTCDLPPEDRSAYGVLINGLGVCESYAEAMQYIMDQLGIPCKSIIGQGNGSAHKWNIIKINGNWYQVDVTWDDPTAPTGKDILSYDYFNVTDEQMRKDHSYTTEYPCTATIDNYFYRSNLLINNYDEFYNKIRDGILNKKDKVEMKIINYTSSVYNVQNAIRQFNAAYKKNGYYDVFYVSDTDGVITITFNFK